MSAMQDAILAAIPWAADRLPLANRISTLDDVVALESDALRRMQAEHDAEILSLTGRIEVSAAERWVQSAKRALNVLRMHRNWIAGELRRRERTEAVKHQREARQAAAASRAENLRRQQENGREIHQAKIARINAANDQTARQTAIFKEVASEVLGREIYEHLWELARQRIAATPPLKGGASE